MSEPTLQLAIKVNSQGLISGLRVATDSVEQATQLIKSNFAQLPPAAKEASEEVGGLTEKLLDLKSELSQESRFASIFSREIAGMGIASKGTAGELAGLAGSFAVGGALGGSLEVVKLLVEKIGEMNNEAKKLAAESEEAFSKFYARINEIREGMEGLTSAEKALKDGQVDLSKTHSKLIDQLHDQNVEVDDLEAKIAKLTGTESKSGQVALLSAINRRDAAKEARAATMQQLEDNERLQEAEKDKAAPVIEEQKTKQLADGLAEQGRKSKQAVEERIKLEQGLKKALFDLEQEDTKDREKYWTERHKAEAAGIMAILKDALHAGEVQEKEDKRLTAEEKKDLKERERAAKEWGNAIGAQFADVATGTESITKAFANMADAGVKAVTDLAIKSIESYAASSEGAAFFSQAGIPIVGPVLAVGAAATAGAFIEGLLSKVPSAAGGWDVPGPRGAAIPAVIHGGEMVLPAPLADNVRRGATGGDDHLHLHGQIIDNAFVNRLAQHPALIRGLVKAVRNNR